MLPSTTDKVPRHRRVLGTSGLLLAMFIAACNGGAETTDERVGLGDPYDIIVNMSAAAPDRPPYLEGDTLVATVGYAGGCEDHTFDLGHDVRGDTARLWLSHDAHGDECEAYLYDEIRLPVPEAALAPPAVLLLNPSDAPPYVLRWRR